MEVYQPVTPAMQSGCAPNTEKMNAAINEDNRTSVTPYSLVVSIKSRENAMPGRTLGLLVQRTDIEKDC